MYARALVVAQLVERSLPIPKVCGSNPVIYFFTISRWVSDLRLVQNSCKSVTSNCCSPLR